MKYTGQNRKRTKNHWRVRNRTGKLLYGDLTERIIGLCYEIHRTYGSGQKESLYQNALEEKLKIIKIPYKREISILIRSEDTNKVIGSHRLDFVVDDKVIIETKSIKFTPAKIEQQLYSYLRNSEFKVGLMINFGGQKTYLRRLVLT